MSTNDSDLSNELRERVRSAVNSSAALCIVGGGSKRFYGRTAQGEELNIGGHRGVVNYEPTELFITVRGGTPLREVEAILADKGQMLPFEPPHFGPGATLGGAIACGLSGPRRPYAGAARDFVLGARVLNGRSDILRFGGEVMKNVAGYDVSRLMVGALGTLGVLLDVSLKILPRPAEEITLGHPTTAAEALHIMNRWAAQPLPLSAGCFDGDRLYVRLSGAAAGVEAARALIGGEVVQDGAAFWKSLREQTHPFFEGEVPLWRLSVPQSAPPLPLEGETLYDWGGAQRWLKTDATVDRVRQVAVEAGGHAMLFRGGDRTGEVFHPLTDALQALNRNLKQAFDPHGIFNPGRMYRAW
jgi:glycolate oxidase FAD binding subunit